MNFLFNLFFFKTLRAAFCSILVIKLFERRIIYNSFGSSQMPQLLQYQLKMKLLKF
jgi:hypothetical protein